MKDKVVIWYIYSTVLPEHSKYAHIYRTTQMPSATHRAKTQPNKLVPASENE